MKNKEYIIDCDLEKLKKDLNDVLKNEIQQ